MNFTGEHSMVFKFSRLFQFSTCIFAMCLKCVCFALVLLLMAFYRAGAYSGGSQFSGAYCVGIKFPWWLHLHRRCSTKHGERQDKKDYKSCLCDIFCYVTKLIVVFVSVTDDFVLWVICHWAMCRDHQLILDKLFAVCEGWGSCCPWW